MLLNCGVGEDLRVPGSSMRSNQSILKEISPEYSSEGLMMKLKLQYFGYLMQKADSLEKTLMLGEIEGGRRRGWQRWDGWMATPTWWTWVWATIGIGDGQGGLACCSPWGFKELETTERLNWTELPEGNHVSVSLLLDEEFSIFFLTIIWENKINKSAYSQVSVFP